MATSLDLTYIDTDNPLEVKDAFVLVASKIAQLEDQLKRDKHNVSGVNGTFSNSAGDTIVIKNGLIKTISRV